MGGNALKGVTTRRYQRDEYLALEQEVLDTLRRDFPGRRIEAIKAYRQKESFGDMDVLLESDNLQVNLSKYVVDTFGAKEVAKNSSVTSFEFKEFQIDLICTTRKNFSTSASYFAWNDLGNLMGRVSHKLGFKYGHEGLSLIFRDGDYQYAEINVSQDPRKIFEFLDYDYDRFLAGFDTISEIFEFTTSSKFFNKEIYALENRNHTSRTRDRKRKTYNEFLTWVETAELQNAYPWATMREQGGHEYKKQFVDRAARFFPDFKVEHDKVQANFKLWKEAKALFNGGLVREWTGLEDKELGLFMKHLREVGSTLTDKWTAWVVEQGAEGVKTWVLNLFNEYAGANSCAR